MPGSGGELSSTKLLPGASPGDFRDAPVKLLRMETGLSFSQLYYGVMILGYEVLSRSRVNLIEGRSPKAVQLCVL